MRNRSVVSLAFSVVVGLLVLISNFASAQQKCGVNSRWEMLKQADPVKYNELLEERLLHKAEVKYIEENSIQKSGTTYIIPIVFHIIHNAAGDGKIPESDVFEAINILNDDFNLRNSDTALINDEFKPILANVGFEFRLAQKDPDGNCSTGINYYEHETFYTQGSNGIYSFVQNQLDNKWKHDEYLNIYVNYQLDGYYGWAYGPTTNINSGVTVASPWVGIGNGSTDNRTLTHEIGHWFNLDHTWGWLNDAGDNSNCNQDDGISDTPLCKGTYGCNQNLNSCDAGQPGDIKDNVQNYMEYGCTIMFTEGQKESMIASLDASIHDNLITEANLIKTGTQDPYTYAGGTACDVVSCEIINVCHDSLNGNLSVKIMGGQPDFSLEWSNGETVIDLGRDSLTTQYGLVPGVYTVTITDIINDTVTCSAEVLDSSNIQVSYTIVDASVCDSICDGSVEVVITGDEIGEPLATFSTSSSSDGGNQILSDGNCGSNQFYIDLQPSLVLSTVDENSIKSICVSFTHPNPADLKFGIEVVDAADSDNYQYLSLVEKGDIGAGPNVVEACFTRDAEETISEGTAPYTGNWKPNDDFTLVDHALVGSKANSLWYLVAWDCANNNEEGTIDSLKITFLNGASSTSYSWSNDSTRESITSVCSGAYTLTVTDNDLCTAV
ncbi:MAG: hypothetical protein HRT72_05710, partial [Flavobacteriales bacterium]|nr:hypothetical protein [Flavobacteriales bacterium]